MAFSPQRNNDRKLPGPIQRAGTKLQVYVAVRINHRHTTLGPGHAIFRNYGNVSQILSNKCLRRPNSCYISQSMIGSREQDWRFSHWAQAWSANRKISKRRPLAAAAGSAMVSGQRGLSAACNSEVSNSPLSLSGRLEQLKLWKSHFATFWNLF